MKLMMTSMLSTLLFMSGAAFAQPQKPDLSQVNEVLKGISADVLRSEQPFLSTLSVQVVPEQTDVDAGRVGAIIQTSTKMAAWTDQLTQAEIDGQLTAGNRNGQQRPVQAHLQLPLSTPTVAFAKYIVSFADGQCPEASQYSFDSQLQVFVCNYVVDGMKRVSDFTALKDLVDRSVTDARAFVARSLTDLRDRLAKTTDPNEKRYLQEQIDEAQNWTNRLKMISVQTDRDQLTFKWQLADTLQNEFGISNLTVGFVLKAGSLNSSLDLGAILPEEQFMSLQERLSEVLTGLQKKDSYFVGQITDFLKEYAESFKGYIGKKTK